LGVPGETFDRHITEAVRNHLFEKSDVPFSGFDLPAINIQRARDHGIPPYIKYREWCGYRKARSFADLNDTSSEEAIQALQKAYRNVEDIDLFPGLMTEKSLSGALLGPTTICIIAEQFNRLRRCDRFWHETDVSETKFTPDQLAELRKVNFAKVLCQNFPFIKLIQPNVFDLPDDLANAQVACQDLPDMDLYAWMERDFCVVDQKKINLGKTGKITPCVACTCTTQGPECHSVTVGDCARLLDEYSLTEVMQDTVCVIQCSGLINQRRKLRI
jgi:hypothetical protein